MLFCFEASIWVFLFDRLSLANHCLLHFAGAATQLKKGILVVKYSIHMHDNIELYLIATRKNLQGTPCTTMLLQRWWSSEIWTCDSVRDIEKSLPPERPNVRLLRYATFCATLDLLITIPQIESIDRNGDLKPRGSRDEAGVRSELFAEGWRDLARVLWFPCQRPYKLWRHLRSRHSFVLGYSSH